MPPPKAVAICLPSTVSLPNPSQRMPRRKSPDSVGVRNPDHCTPKVFFPAISAGRLLSVSLTLASVRLTMGGGRIRSRLPSPHAFVVVGLEAGLAVGSGQKSIRHRVPSVRRNWVPGTKVMVALGNSA